MSTPTLHWQALAPRLMDKVDPWRDNQAILTRADRQIDRMSTSAMEVGVSADQADLVSRVRQAGRLARGIRT
jgi:hypothetical protein